MKTLLLSCLALSCLSLSAQAHEIWIERDASGPVQIYFGEPAQDAPAHGDDEIKRVVSPKVFGSTASAGKVQRNGGHLQAPLRGDGDAWLFDDKVFEPWKGENGQYESVTYYARAGRSSTAARLDFELVPQQADSAALTVLYRNKPLADAEVTVIDPQKWQKQLTSDAKGQLTLPALRPGRHIVVVSHKEPVQQQIGGQSVALMHHISTLTFVAK